MRKLGILILIVALAAPMFMVHAQSTGDFRKTFDLGTTPAADGPLAGVDPSGQKVVWWHNHSSAREELVNAIVADFNAQNPWGITVEASNQGSYGDIFNKTLAAIQAGQGAPNLVVAYQNNAAAYYLAGGLTEDMDVYVKDTTWGLNEAEVADFVPGFFTQDYTPDGAHRIGFPPNRSLEGLYFNLTALKELGYDAPPTDWATFREMACKFTESGWSGYNAGDQAGYYVRTDASNIAAGTFALGGDIFDGTAFDFANPATVEYLQFMVSLYKDGCAQLITENYGDQNAFTAGKALFYVGSTSGLPFIQTGIEDAFATPFEWSVAALPYKDVPVSDVYGASVSILKSTPEAELATWLFVRWFTESEQQSRWVGASKYFPVRYSAAEGLAEYFADMPQYEAAWNLLQGETKVEPQLASYDAIRNEASATFQNLLAGQGDVETALTDLTNAANEILASYQVPAAQ